MSIPFRVEGKKNLVYLMLCVCDLDADV